LKKGKLTSSHTRVSESGVWQKTGWNTFAVTLLTIEYQVDSPNTTLFQFAKVQYVGFLKDSGDRMEITAAAITNFNPDGKSESLHSHSY
jgi:hypothetical protein